MLIVMERSPEKPLSSTPEQDKASDGGSEPSTRNRSQSPKQTDMLAATASSSGDDAPPLPDEPPPLPTEVPPTEPVDDGWAPVWDDTAQAFYFYNKFTNATQWENPRIPEVVAATAPGVANHDRIQDEDQQHPAVVTSGYSPAVHGDYDPTADYAQDSVTVAQPSSASGAPGTDPAAAYAATGTFNRFTGKWQNADFTTERFSDEQKSKRQMNAFFDVDAAANSHNGRSLRAERANQKISKTQLKAFKEKRREKKEEKRRAWLRD